MSMMSLLICKREEKNIIKNNFIQDSSWKISEQQCTLHDGVYFMLAHGFYAY